MSKEDKLKYLKYYNSPNRMGGNYYKDSDHTEFDMEGSICAEAEKSYLSYAIPDMCLQEYKKSKAYAALQGDGVPTDLKASLYRWWKSALIEGDTDEEFIEFYSKMY